MAWRIESYLVRGEIDNRIRDRVTGRLWFLGRAEPIELELYGNARRDLAGKRLEFTNPLPKAGLDSKFASQQIGVVSEFTASKKVRVPDIRLTDDVAHGQYHASVSWRGGNAIYLEWFSLASGRVLLESTEFRLILDSDSCWEMTAQEETLQRIANARAIELFNREIEFLAHSGTDEVSDEPKKPDGSNAPADPWGTEAPEFDDDVDDLLADSDRLTERLMERIEQAGENADLEAIVKEELERRLEEHDERSGTFEDDSPSSFEELNAASLDDVPSAGFETAPPPHPLAERARSLTARVVNTVELNRWASSRAGANPVVELMTAIARAGSTLATALNSYEWPPTVEECGVCLASLKHARGLFRHAAIAAEFCYDSNLVPRVWLRTVQFELDEIGADADEIMSDLRARLEQGFD